MFLYNFASWMLETLCICSLDAWNLVHGICLGWSLRCRNPGDALKWKICSKQGRMGFCQAPSVLGDGPAYVVLNLRTLG